MDKRKKKLFIFPIFLCNLKGSVVLIRNVFQSNLEKLKIKNNNLKSLGLKENVNVKATLKL